MSDTDLFGLILDGKLVEGPRELPASWRTDDAEILAFDRLDDPTPYGWWPWVEEIAPAFDPARQRVEPTIRLVSKANRIVRGYSVVDLTAQEIAAAAPPMPDISDGQFGYGLWLDGVISYEEYLGFVGPGELPATLEALIASLPDDDTDRPTPRKVARGDLKGRKTFQFAHPLVDTVRTLMAQRDPIWTPAHLRERWLAWSKL